jgi:hypothetical protein
MGGAVVSESRWLAWVRALSRASVLVFCGIVMTAVQAVLGVLQASIGVRVGAAFFVAAVAPTTVQTAHDKIVGVTDAGTLVSEVGPIVGAPVGVTASCPETSR